MDHFFQEFFSVKYSACLFVLMFFALSASLNAQKEDFFLMQGHSLLSETQHHAKVVELLVEAGVEVFRDEVYWSNVEKEKDKLVVPPNWNENVDLLVARGIQPLLILNYSNDLYDGGHAPHTSEGRAAFVRFCEFMVKETKGRIKYFEFWNEPNLDGFWPPVADGKNYALLLKEVYPAIKIINPDSIVLGCSLSGLPEDYLDDVLSNGSCKYMDALSIHPYCYPKTVEEADIWDMLSKARLKTAEYGSPKDIWVTEIGFPTNLGGGVTEEYQANMVSRSYIKSLTHPWLKTFGWYWFGPDGPDRNNNEDNFGLIREDWSKKPGFNALKTVIATFSEAQYIQDLKLGNQIESPLFQVHQDEYNYLTALWSWGDKQQIQIDQVPAALLILRDGEKIPLSSDESKCILLDVSQEPIFLLSKKLPRIQLLGIPKASFVKNKYNVTSVSWNTIDMVMNTDLNGSLGKLTCDPMEIPPHRISFKAGTNQNLVKSDIKAKPSTLCQTYPLQALLQDSEGQFFGRIVTDLQVQPAVSITLTPNFPIGKHLTQFTAEITNQSTSPTSVTLQLKEVNGTKLSHSLFNLTNLGPSETFKKDIDLTSDKPHDAIYKIQSSITLENGESLEQETLLSFYQSPKLSSTIKIDGKLNDWPKGFDPIVLDSARQITRNQYPWDGASDSSAMVWTAWDKEFFYLAAEVTDDIFSDGCQGYIVYNNDGLEVYFDTDLMGDREVEYYSDDDNQYGLFSEQGKAIVYAWSHLNDYSPGATISINRTPEKEHTISNTDRTLLIEAKIPHAEINLPTPSYGDCIGFNVALNDDDTPDEVHPFGQDLQLSWTAQANAWQRPAAFAYLFFVDPEAKGPPKRKGTEYILPAEK